MQGGDNRTIVGRICFHCEKPIPEDAQFCEHCGGDLDLAKWMASQGMGAAPAPVDQAPSVIVSEAPPEDPWLAAKQRLSQIPPEQLLGARPDLPSSPLELVYINDNTTHALIIGVEGCYLLHLQEMRAQRLLASSSTGRRGAISADGTKVLISDQSALYFFDITLEGEAPIRAFEYPELNTLQGEISVAIGPQVALAAQGGDALFLFNWETGAITETIPLPAEGNTEPPRLFFAPDGSLFCGLAQQTFLFDSQGGSQSIPGVKVSLSPDGTKMAAFLYGEDVDNRGIFYGEIQSLIPFTWSSQELTHLEGGSEIVDISFSADGSLLLLRARAGQGESLDVVSAQTANRILSVKDPTFPGSGFGRIRSAALSNDGRLFLFADSFSSYYAFEQSPSLLCFLVAPFGYLGAVRLIQRAGIEGSPFAAPEGDIDVCLPFGETPTGYFGRLDIAAPIGAEWSSPLEYPELVQRVLLGEPERGLLADVALLARDDLDARLSFWFSLGVMAGLPGLVDASIGLTHLLPGIVSIAGGDKASNEALLKACQTVASYSDAEKENVFQGVPVIPASLKEFSSAETMPLDEPGPPPLPMPALPMPSPSSLQAAPKPAPKAAPKPAPRPAPKPPGDPSVKRTANATMVADASVLEQLQKELASPPPPPPLQSAPIAPQSTAASPSGRIPIVVVPNAIPAAPSEAPAPFSQGTPAPFSQGESAAPPDPKAAQKAELTSKLLALNIPAEAEVALLALPLCEVVWADGESQAKESELVTKYIVDHVALKSPAASTLANQWLKKCPPADYCDKARALLREMVKAEYSQALTKDALKEVMRLCNEIAGAVGGFLGLGKVSKEEKAILTKIEAAFKID